MTLERFEQALWLEWSGLPAALNKVRANGWLVMRKVAELDCAAHRRPEAVEVTLEELGARCGLEPDVVVKVLEALRKKKYLRCFIPDNASEPALIEIRSPIKTPLPPDEVAKIITDPHLRDPGDYRYARAEDEPKIDDKKVQEAVDYYLNHLSQKMNSVILEQIEIAARRFTAESLRLAIDRAARHEIRSMTWVLKELIRDHQKQSEKNY
ncbi:MAG: hypothetical protein ABFD69_14385 [Candidatus Sumerlaeia bacterium]